MASIRKRGGRYQVRGAGIHSKTFSRAEDAKLYKADQERRKGLGELYVASPESFGACLGSYLERRKGSWRPKTYKNSLEVAKYLRPLRSLSTKDVTRAELEDLVSAVASRAPRMAQMALALAKSVLRDCQARRVPIDPACLTIPPPRYDVREGRFLSLTDLYELASHMDYYFQRMVLVAGLTGMRQGELRALKSSQLNLEAGTLWVERGKTVNARRTVYLSKRVVAILKEQLMIRPAKDTEYVFPAPEGGMLGKDNLMHRYFRPAREAAGFPDLTFHDLKHTFISLAAQQGVKRELIGEMAGWSPRTVDAMLARYRHVYPQEVTEAVAQLDALMEEQG